MLRRKDMPDKSNSASTGTRNVHRDGRNYSNHVNGSRSLPNSAVHKPVPGQGGRGGKSK